MVEPWAVEFEKSERMDNTYREVTLSQCNSLPRRLTLLGKGVLQMFLLSLGVFPFSGHEVKREESRS
jgi:hypothetical protein